MLGVRLDPKTERLLAALAKQRRTTKSALVREAIQRYVAEATLADRAREQSLRVSGGQDRGDEDEFEHDDRDWTP